jgi:hypothetical protein
MHLRFDQRNNAVYYTMRSWFSKLPSFLTDELVVIYKLEGNER